METQNGMDPQLTSEQPVKSSDEQAEQKRIASNSVPKPSKPSPEAYTTVETKSTIVPSEKKKKEGIINTSNTLQSTEEKQEDEKKTMETNQKKKSNDAQQEELTNNKSRSESDIRDHKVSKPVEAGLEVSTGIAITSTTVPPEEKSTEEITTKNKSVEDIQDQKNSKSSKGSLGVLTAAAKTSISIPSASEEKKEKDTVNTSGTVLYAEKDKNKEKGTEDNHKKKTEVVHQEATIKKKSKSGEDIPDDTKGKTWIWWGVLGGLLLVIGGVLKIANTSKTQHVGGERQEKQTQRHRDAPVTLLIHESN